MFAGMKRSLIGGRLREGAKKSMEGINKKLEAGYRKETCMSPELRAPCLE